MIDDPKPPSTPHRHPVRLRKRTPKADEPKPASGILDKLNGKIGKIVTLCVTIGALGAAVTQLTGIGTSMAALFHLSRTAAPLDCFNKTAKLSHPKTVSLRQWDSMKLRLTGRNDCKTSLFCITLHGGGDGITVEPMIAVDDPLCWQKGRLASGPFDWPLIPTRLAHLGAPLGRPAQVYIN